MRVFLTGGTGFIGKAVVDALKGHELYRLDHDLRQVNRLGRALDLFRPEVCVHCAWKGLPDYSPEVCQENYSLTAGLFELLDCKTVALGSCFEYGDLQGCVKEEDAPVNLSYFAATKTALRLYGERLYRQRGREFLWVRPFYVYGPGQRGGSLIPSVYRGLKEGGVVEIRNPDTLQDFVHVDDVASGVARLATSQAAPGVYNIGTGRPSLVRQVVNVVADLVGKSHPLREPDKYFSSEGVWASMDKAFKAGVQHKTPFPEGLAATVAAWERA